MAAVPSQDLLSRLWGAAKSAGGNLASVPEQIKNFPQDIRQLANDPKRIGELSRQAALSVGPGIMAGENAVGAPLASLRLGRAMEAAGHSPEEIWSSTKTFKDVDGNWKWEIPDDTSSLRSTEGARAAKIARGGHPMDAYQAQDALDHPALWDAYPGLAKTEIKVIPQDRPGDLAAGTYFAPPTAVGKESIELKPYADAEDQTIHSTLLHELNHGVQAREGFARGGSPSQFLPPTFQADVAATNEFLNSHQDLFAKVGIDQGVLESGLAKLRAGQRGSLTDGEFDSLQRYTALPSGVVGPYNKALRKADELQQQQDAAFKQYNSLAGENSSKNVQERFESGNYETPPWQMPGYPQGPQLLKDNSPWPQGRQMALPEPGPSHTLQPVDHDPWLHEATPVEHDPFAAGEPGPAAAKDLKSAAQAGINGDTLLGHLTPGDTIVSAEKLANPEVARDFQAFAQKHGINLSRFTAGADNSLNPTTGLPQFDDEGGGGGDAGGGDGGGGDAGGDGSGGDASAGGGGEGGYDTGDASAAGGDANSGATGNGGNIGNPDAAATEAAQAAAGNSAGLGEGDIGAPGTGTGVGGTYGFGTAADNPELGAGKAIGAGNPNSSLDAANDAQTNQGFFGGIIDSIAHSFGFSNVTDFNSTTGQFGNGYTFDAGKLAGNVGDLALGALPGMGLIEALSKGVTGQGLVGNLGGLISGDGISLNGPLGGLFGGGRIGGGPTASGSGVGIGTSDVGIQGIGGLGNGTGTGVGSSTGNGGGGGNLGGQGGTNVTASGATGINQFLNYLSGGKSPANLAPTGQGLTGANSQLSGLAALIAALGGTGASGVLQQPTTAPTGAQASTLDAQAGLALGGLGLVDPGFLGLGTPNANGLYGSSNSG